MPVSEDLTVAYHQQDTDYYCGAACAQMVLDSIGAGLLNQDDLYNDNHAHSTAESGWYSAPDGVLWTMNALKPPSPTFNSYFVLDALDHEDSISRCIVWTIHHYKVAPIAMVYGAALARRAGLHCERCAERVWRHELYDLRLCREQSLAADTQCVQSGRGGAAAPWRQRWLRQRR
jgi:hypothetical protein